jgi:hypothetical protein
METESAASAIGTIVASERPARISGIDVSVYPKRNAYATASAMEATLPHPRAVAITKPVTSPITHPVRQWFVALAASRFREPLDPCAWCDTLLR